jgi:hypothetical protein
VSEYFIQARSFGAPFVSDESTAYMEAASPQRALELYAAGYDHPAGLYAAEAYTNADAFHKGEKPLAQWLCNHERAKQQLTADLDRYPYLGHGPGDFEIDGVRHHIDDPKSGSVTQP